jgi:hypothetical protein
MDDVEPLNIVIEAPSDVLGGIEESSETAGLSPGKQSSSQVPRPRTCISRSRHDEAAQVRRSCITRRMFGPHGPAVADPYSCWRSLVFERALLKRRLSGLAMP